MPYDYDPNLDPKDPKNDPNAPPQLAGSSQVVGGGSATQAAPTATTGTSSGQFQNLQDYLNANQGSDFGQQFAGKIQGEVGKADTAQQESANQFRQVADNATINEDKDLTSRALSSPTDFVNNQDDLNAFGRQRDATYGGPNSFADQSGLYSKAEGATRNARDFANAADTEGGRFALLDNYFGRSDYSQGQKGLDNLLVSNDQKFQEGVQQAKTNAAQAQQNFQKENTDLTNYANTAKQTTAATRANTRQALGIDDAGNPLAFDSDATNNGALQNAYEPLQQKISDMQTKAQEGQTMLGQIGTQTDLSQLTPEQLKYLGIDNTATASPDASKLYYNWMLPQFNPTPGTSGGMDNPTYLQWRIDHGYADPHYKDFDVGAGNTFGIRAQDYGSSLNPADLNPDTVADTGTAQKIAALSKLSNINNTFVDPNDPNLGKYADQMPSTFKTQDYTTAIQGARQNYINDINSYLTRKGQGQIAPQNSTAELNSIRRKYGLSDAQPIPVRRADGSIVNYI